MRKEELLEAFGGLDDDLLMRSENGSKKVLIGRAVKYGTMAACLMVCLGMAYMFGVNQPVPIDDPMNDPLQGSPIEETMVAGSREGTDSNDPLQGSTIEKSLIAESQEGAKEILVAESQNGANASHEEALPSIEGETYQAGGKAEDLSSGAKKESASESEVQASVEDVPADGKGEYVEVNNNDIMAKEVSDFYGGSYLDANGRFTIVLTEDTPENRTAVCGEFGRSMDKTAFVTGKYTLKYLTELQEKISNGMINKELSFVVSSAVSETSNCMVVCVTTDDEAELAKLYGLDQMGGAIKVEHFDGSVKDLGAALE